MLFYYKNLKFNYFFAVFNPKSTSGLQIIKIKINRSMVNHTGNIIK